MVTRPRRPLATAPKSLPPTVQEEHTLGSAATTTLVLVSNQKHNEPARALAPDQEFTAADSGHAEYNDSASAQAAVKQADSAPGHAGQQAEPAGSKPSTARGW